MPRISTKRAPTVSGENSVQISRAFSQVYDDINEIINAVNASDTTLIRDGTEGKSGDIRIVKTVTGDYSLEVRTEEGWVQSIVTFNDGSTQTGFKFRKRS
tara:strand:- start:479 stop:778 length:300 start_codon:yes stop_codon:yes gene_type:complete